VAKRNKKVLKLRAYRDKLLEKITNLESTVRRYQELCRSARKALQQDKHLRAYAIVSDDEGNEHLDVEMLEKNELAAELSLVYRFLIVERRYTEEVSRAAHGRDYLRVAALTADHTAESVAHEKMLTRWSADHGFTRSLRDEDNNTIV